MGSGAERRLALREKECAEVFGACAAHATGRFSATFVDEHSQAESQIILGECERERGSFCRCSCSHSFVNLNNNDNNHKKKSQKILSLANGFLISCCCDSFSAAVS